MQAEEDRVLERAERDRGGRRLGELPPDRRLLAREDPEAQKGEVDEQRDDEGDRRRERLGNARRAREGTAVQPITKTKLNAEATA